MEGGDKLASVARKIVDANRYMVVATADSSGQPWATPVFFAHQDYRQFFWVSEPDASHSINLRGRREVGIVIFNSTRALGKDQGLYVLGVARELPAHETVEGIRIFSKRSREEGGSGWTRKDVSSPAKHRLYQATAEASYVLDEHAHRVEVSL
jgi:nitroimidazol reductase NimA-like FMN-containing flavoprotein (pyridoxamine 5'-phosphate oxidase superfamily)